jgi:catalase
MNDDRKTLTTRQGHPVADNQSMRSVGERGPATLENYQFIEKITHFDRERIPERVVHARGTGGIATRITVAGWRLAPVSILKRRSRCHP